jgi:HAD superfamily hydrolase (TIGR01509 family)
MGDSFLSPQEGDATDRLKAIVFDFDGLIIDSETAIAGAWRELYAAHDRPLPEHLLRRMLGTRENDHLLWDELQALAGPLDLEALRASHRARGVALANELPLLPGVRKQLDAARDAGLRLAVASSSSAWWVHGHLERLGIRDRFAAVCSKEDSPRSKPDPGVYLAALRRLEVLASDAVAIEDSEPGVAAAKAAGLRCVAVPGSFTEQMSFAKADLVLPSLEELDLDRLSRSFG